jgi:hypothetical protein
MPSNNELTCHNCGEELEKRWQFCPICGMNLAEAEAASHHRTDYKTEAGRLSHYAELFASAKETLEANGDLEDALSDCEAAIEFDPNSAEAYNLRGLILDLLERKEQAIESYREALRLNPGYADAVSNLNDAEAEQRDQQFQLISLDDSEQKKFGWQKPVLIAFVVLLLAWVFLDPGNPLNLFKPVSALVFEPDYSKTPNVDKAVLEETARILTERCDSMGCDFVTFTVSDDNQIVGKVPVYLNLDVESLSKEITTIGLLEFTDFGKTPFAEGTFITTDFEHPFFPQVELESTWHTIMTNREIESATVSKDQLGRYVIDFTLTEKGIKIFTQYTSENVGSYLGILLDKVVLSAPLVNGPITTGQGQISGNFDEESAKNLAAYLNIEPLPIPLVVVEVGK